MQLYIVEFDNGFIKVGVSCDAKDRIASIGLPKVIGKPRRTRSMIFLDWPKDALDIEGSAIAIFTKLIAGRAGARRVKYEWFYGVPYVVACIIVNRLIELRGGLSSSPRLLERTTAAYSRSIKQRNGAENMSLAKLLDDPEKPTLEEAYAEGRLDQLEEDAEAISNMQEKEAVAIDAIRKLHAATHEALRLLTTSRFS